MDVAGNIGAASAALPVTVIFDLTLCTHRRASSFGATCKNVGAGASVHSAGDINGDGFDDVIVGAPCQAWPAMHSYGYATYRTSSEAYVVFGTDAGFGTATGGRQLIDAASLTAAQGFIIRDLTPDAEAGRSVSAAGDVNGDGCRPGDRRALR